MKESSVRFSFLLAIIRKRRDMHQVNLGAWGLLVLLKATASHHTYLREDQSAAGETILATTKIELPLPDLGQKRASAAQNPREAGKAWLSTRLLFSCNLYRVGVAEVLNAGSLVCLRPLYSTCGAKFVAGAVNKKSTCAISPYS